MKKLIFQFSLILLIIAIGIMSVFITTVNADSITGLNVPSSVKPGENLTVSLILPSNAIAAQAVITVSWSDGKTNTQTLAYTTGLSDNSVSFSTKDVATGTAKVTASKIIVTASNGSELENGGTKEASVNIVGNQQPATNTGNSNSNSDVKFTDVNETVYTNDRVNFRKSYSTTSERIRVLETGTKLTRTGIGNNGWSRVNYNGQTGYISSQYLTTQTSNTPSTPDTTNTSNTDDNKKENEDVKFKDVNEKMYALQNCNLRKSWSTDSDKVGYLSTGQEVTRTGVADNGWSRITYNGQVVYIATRLLTNKKPEENKNEIENTVANEVANEISNEVVNEVTNELTEEEKLAAIQEEVGVLPEVGNNIANNLYIIITILAISLVSAGMYFYLKKSE